MGTRKLRGDFYCVEGGSDGEALARAVFFAFVAFSLGAGHETMGACGALVP